MSSKYNRVVAWAYEFENHTGRITPVTVEDWVKYDEDTGELIEYDVKPCFVVPAVADAWVKVEIGETYDFYDGVVYELPHQENGSFVCYRTCEK